MTPKPFFYFDKLTLFDKITIAVYTLYTAFLTIDLLIEKPVSMSGTYNCYIIATPLFIIAFLYAPLRNFSYYLIWLGFSILHILLYFTFKANHVLQNAHGHPLTGLLHTGVLLILFQVLRFVSLKAQRREFIVPYHGKDTYTLEKVRALDYVLGGVYFIVFIVLLKLSF